MMLGRDAGCLASARAEAGTAAATAAATEVLRNDRRLSICSGIEFPDVAAYAGCKSGQKHARDLKLAKVLLKERETGGRGQQQAVRGRLRV